MQKKLHFHIAYITAVHFSLSIIGCLYVNKKPTTKQLFAIGIETADLANKALRGTNYNSNTTHSVTTYLLLIV